MSRLGGQKRTLWTMVILKLTNCPVTLDEASFELAHSHHIIV